MDKLKMHSPNLVDVNIEKISALFPNCITETNDENGELKKAVDFDLLKQELSQVLVEGEQERYRLDWVGKKEAILTANAPIAKTLRPCHEESINFDKTENLFIEGDNLEALKLLQENYLGKVKMIYIDPPYNTGNDFIYEDDFAESTDAFFEKSNQVDKEGNRLIANTESNGRFHSDWLSMMYSRLKLARNLLRDDGSIVVSIDNNEIDNCKKILSEVFGNNNYISTISNFNNPKGRSDDKFIATANEYILVFCKDINKFQIGTFDLESKIIDRYNKIDTDGRRYREIDLRKTGENDLREDRPNLFYYFYFNQETKEFFPSRENISIDGYIQIKPLRQDNKEGNWRWGLDSANQKISQLIPKFMPTRQVWGVMEKDFLDKRTGAKATTIWDFKDVNSERGSEQFISLGFDKRIFQNPKPIGTIYRCIKLFANNSSDLIMDFFAGSGTTACAIQKYNMDNGGSRKFIMVQIPEQVDETKEAFKAGYKTIAEISKERIRRAGKKILEDNATKEGIENLDIGFRVLKIDSTNMKDVYYIPDSLKQSDLLDLASNIKEDRTSEDLLFQVMLDWGLNFHCLLSEKLFRAKKYSMLLVIA